MQSSMEGNLDPAAKELLGFFTYEHLPAALQKVSAPFAQAAAGLVSAIGPSRERTAALRKLLEAKDCAVRGALLDQQKESPS